MAWRGQLRLETFAQEAVLFINGHSCQKYHEGGIQKQPTQQEALNSDNCAESALSRPPERSSGLRDLAWSRIASEGQDNRNGPTEWRSSAGARIWPVQRWQVTNGRRAGRGCLLILDRSID